MLQKIASRIMRTTIDIDDPVLKELKRLQRREGKSLGRLASDLLAKALAELPREREAAGAPRWISRPMGARVDLSDRDAVLDAMDGPS
jgi:Arc/MetJ family transcription regulator